MATKTKPQHIGGMTFTGSEIDSMSTADKLKLAELVITEATLETSQYQFEEYENRKKAELALSLEKEKRMANK